MKKLLFLILLTIVPISIFCQGQPPEMPDGYSSITTLKMAYFFGTLDLIEKDFPLPENIVEKKDIIYKTIDSTQLKLDIYFKNNVSKPAPLLVFIHGGAWKKGDKHDYLRYLVDYAQKGYVTATIQYRFTNKAKFPAQLLDIKSAIKWLKVNSEKYNIDSSKIAVIGGSAGGHLAMMVGYTSDVPEFNIAYKSSSVSPKVQAVVNLYGPSNLTTEYAREQKSVKQLTGKQYSEAPELFLQASPSSYISKDDSPTLIFQGTLDELVPFAQSDSLYEKLNRAGVPAEYHKLEGWPHTMDLSVEVNAYCQYYMDRFFEKYLLLKK